MTGIPRFLLSFTKSASLHALRLAKQLSELGHVLGQSSHRDIVDVEDVDLKAVLVASDRHSISF
jgi:hypothetical protein